MTGFEAHAHASQPDAAHYGSQAALAALREHFGYESFRPGQAELIEAIASNRDVLGVMPTGSGKSVCYQIPALLLHGITIVISPLISLMRDQVDGANEIGIPAAFINTTQTMDEQEQVLDAAYAGKVKLLYVAPERLETPRFRNFAARADIALIAVDEAHCVSQWGQDFRSSYLGIGEFIAALPDRPTVAAFTATATERVRRDIVQLLGLRDPLVLVTGFDRTNLYFDMLKLNTREKANWIANYVAEHADESGIVYQNPFESLDPRWTAFRSVAEPLRLRDRRIDDETCERRVREALTLVSLDPDEIMWRYPMDLSGGQAQRVAIARAIVTGPSVLLADEAMSAIDVAARVQILDAFTAIRARNPRMAMLFVSHDLGVVQHIADRVLVLHEGRVVERGTVRQILETPQEDYTKALIEAATL